MKGGLKKKIFLMTIVTLLFAAFCIGCVKKTTNNGDDVAGETQIQLLSFDSYSEITGTKLMMRNELGKISINKDKAYLTEGKGSMKIEIQGDYNTPSKHPYLQFNCIGTTVATRDFSNLKNVSMDVYNNTEETLSIAVTMTAVDSSDITVTLPKKTFTLEPKAWTTCSYSLADEMFTYEYYNLSEMNTIKVEFLEHKTSKDDVPNEIYIDNLMGTSYTEEIEKKTYEYDFYEGIDFEDELGHMLFGTNDVERNCLTLSTANYESEGIETPGLGSYGLKGVSKNAVYPALYIKYGEAIPKNTALTFKAYVKTEATDVKYTVASRDENGSFHHTTATSGTPFNEWFDVRILLNADDDIQFVYFNFANAGGDCAFGNEEVEIYMDNFKLSTTEATGDFFDGVTFEQPGEENLLRAPSVFLARTDYASEGINAEGMGSYGLKAASGTALWPNLYMNLGDNARAGAEITFKAYVKVDATSGDFKIVSRAEDKSYTNKVNAECVLNQWFDVSIILGAETEELFFYFNFEESNRQSVFGDKPVTIYLDNISISNFDLDYDFYDGITFENKGEERLFTGNNQPISRVTYKSEGIEAEDLGTYGLKGKAGKNLWPGMFVNFGSAMPAGAEVKFKAYVKVDATSGDYKITSRAFDKKFTNKVNSPNLINEWFDVSVVLGAETDELFFYFNFEDADRKSVFGNKEVTIYLDNFVVSYTDVKELKYDFYEGITFEKEGEQVLFDSSTNAFSRVSYAEEGIKAEGLGTYGIKGNAGTNLWPDVYINYGKSIPKNTILSFKAYIQVDSKVDSFRIVSRDEDKKFSHSINVPEYKVNEWFDVKIVLQEADDRQFIYFNFEEADRKSVFGDKKVTIYLDDFKLTEAADLIVEGEDGSITLNNSLGTPTSRVEIKKPAKAGQVFSFDFEYNTSEQITLWVLADGKWNSTEEPDNEVYKADGVKWTEKHKVSFVMSKDVDFVTIVVRYEGFGDLTKSSCTISNIKIDSPTLDFDFYEGIGFENEYDELCMTEQINGENHLTLSRVAYADTNIKAEGLGDYALKGDATRSLYPLFYVEYGKPIPKDTVLTFKAYIEVDATDVKYSISSRDEDKAYYHTVSTTGYPLNEWFDVTIKLGAEDESQYIYFNFCEAFYRKSLFGDKKVTVYMDDFKLTDNTVTNPKYLGMGTQIGFEDPGEIASFSTGDNAHSMALLSIVEYAKEGITGSNGNYGLKGTVKSGSNYPRFYVDFKETVPAGSVLKFKVYVPSQDSTNKVSVTSKDANGTNNNTPLPNTIPTNTWTEITMTINHAQEQLYTYFYVGNLTDKPTVIYMDDFELIDTTSLTNGWESVIGFENASDMKYFSHNLASNNNNMTSLELVDYASAGIPKEAGSGNYALKGNVLATKNYDYPRFYIDFGKDVPAGSKLKFRVYVPSDDSVNKVTAIASAAVVGGASNKPSISEMSTNTWTEITIDLGTNGKAQQQLYIYFYIRGISDKPEAIYMDNFELIDKDSATNGWETGIGFENANDANYFSTDLKSYGHNMKSLTVVDYTSAGIPKETGSGNNVLKGETPTNYPRFYIDFGQTLKAGTQLRFKVYVPSDDTTNKVTISSKDIDEKNYNSPVPNPTNIPANTWTEVTLNLNTDQKQLYIYFYIGNLTDKPTAIYMDNFELSSWKSGIGFESASDIKFFSHDLQSYGHNMKSLTVVDYASAGIPKETGSGNNVLKGETPTNYPRFYIDFGQTLKAGTQLKFKVYVPSDDTTNKVTISSKDIDEKNYNSPVPNPTNIPTNTWTEVTLNLNTDQNQLKIWFYIGGLTNKSTAIYMDDFKLVTP